MPVAENSFKRRLLSGDRLIGLWLGLANSYTAEVAAGAKFDWLVIDGEHAPNDVRSILSQLQAIAPYSSSAVVRLPMGEAWLIKQILDIGAQTLLIPMIETAEQARRLVEAVRYPPQGNRGIGTALARASRFNAIPDYIATANAEICLLIQVETVIGVAALPSLLEVEGVDGIFIGPSDLAADMGFPGKPGEPEVISAVKNAIQTITACDKRAGLLSSDPVMLLEASNAGASFVAVGTDVGVLTSGLRELHDRFA